MPWGKERQRGRPWDGLITICVSECGNVTARVSELRNETQSSMPCSVLLDSENFPQGIYNSSTAYQGGCWKSLLPWIKLFHLLLKKWAVSVLFPYLFSHTLSILHLYGHGYVVSWWQTTTLFACPLLNHRLSKNILVRKYLMVIISKPCGKLFFFLSSRVISC